MFEFSEIELLSYLLEFFLKTGHDTFRHSLLEAKRDFRTRNLTLSKASKLILAIITTQQSKEESKSWVSRPSRTSKKKGILRRVFPS